MTIYVERTSPGVSEWKVKDTEGDNHSFVKLTLHDRNQAKNSKHGVQIKFARNVVTDPNKDPLQENKELAYHRVVAENFGPQTCREISKAFAEAANEIERRNQN